MTAFIDSDHAGNYVTRRSQTGIIIFLCMAPIIWFSKRQNTVETSSFGSEFIALRTGVEIIESLRYKLRMFGIPIDNSTFVFCDNQSVITNSTTPGSKLKKKHVSISYHRFREIIASGVIKIAYVPTKDNLADVLTKTLGGPQLKHLCQAILS